jgi:protein SCO1/2
VSRLARAAAAAVALLAVSGWAGADPAPPASIYDLEAPLRSQDGRAIGLDVHRGHPVMITMFYGGCPMACPLIIETLRAVERDLDAKQRANLRVLMISIDPRRDSPEALAELAKTRRIDTTRWTLARADETDVRKIAATLGIQYRQLPNGEFSHASIITVLNERGEIVTQSAELGRADPRLLAALR